MTSQISSPALSPIDAAPDEKTSPWHTGEVEMQRLAGVKDQMAEIGKRVLRDHLIDQHRQFFPQLPFAVFGTVDDKGDVWATIRAHHPGFLYSPDPEHLSVSLHRDETDPADSGMENGKAIGMIGIELNTRRRNRLNGRIIRNGDDQFAIRVGHSFGNCPQYIRLRDFDFVRDPDIIAPHRAETATELDDRARAMIGAADTFFVASYVDRGGTDQVREIDVSHRGGKAGFVDIDDDGTLTIPDFAGNLFFNTLGNILRNPKAGLVFADFATGDVLQITGDAEIINEGPEVDAFQGAERLWRVFPRKVVWRKSALPIRWRTRADGVSPNSLLTGDWAQAEQKLSAMRAAQTWRPFRITRITEENRLIKSFHLKPADEGGLLPFQAGQHLPIRLHIGNSTTAPLIRTYTLSSSPSDGAYRISVKREGVASTHLHDQLNVGDLIEARAPAGNFTLDPHAKRPAVLLAGGIGITPMIAMLRHIVYQGLRTRTFRRTWLFYATQNRDVRAFDDEIADLIRAAQGNIRMIRVLADPSGAEPRKDYEASGHIDMNLLRAVLPFDDFDFYLCGPPPFMQAIYDGLRGLNIGNDRIHAEAFGPASLTRTYDSASELPDLPPARQQATEIVFAQSGQKAVWQPEADKTLLELAEDAGLDPEASCRGGSCGTCKTKIRQGSVTYKTRPTASVAPDEALICSARPADTTEDKEVALILDL